jgi:hypothetical protein
MRSLHALPGGYPLPIVHLHFRQHGKILTNKQR